MVLTFMTMLWKKPEAMTDALSEKLENYNVDVNLEEVGIVEKIGDGIATVIGMKKRYGRRIG